MTQDATETILSLIQKSAHAKIPRTYKRIKTIRGLGPPLTLLDSTDDLLKRLQQTEAYIQKGAASFISP